MKIISTIRIIAPLLAIIVVGSISARAQLIINTSTAYLYHDTDPSNPSASTIASDLGITTAQLGTLLFDTDSTGSLQSSYSSTSVGTYPVYLNYVGGTVASGNILVIKDGNMGSYFFNLGSTGTDALNWNGTEQIEILDLFGKGNGDLSHFEFYGGNTPTPTPVPEASTIFAGLALLIPLGIGLARVSLKQAKAN